MMKGKPASRVKVWILALLGVALLVVVEEAGRRAIASFLLPTGGAEWIWASDHDHQHQPVAFYAVRDFELSDRPLSATLMSLADEESVVFLNGVAVGASRYFHDAPVISYDVGDTLRRGRNRILAELRSSRGIGGFLLRLGVEAETGPREILSDASWQIYRRPLAGMFDTDSRLPRGESPRVWGTPPTGRWTLPRRTRSLPTIDRLTSSAEPEGARRVRVGADSTVWQPVGRTNRFSPPLGSWVTFDWGREVAGYVALRFPQQGSEDQQQPIGLIYFGSKPPDVDKNRPDGYLVAMSGQQMWLEALPRRFRYMAFVGLCELSGAEVYSIDPERADSMFWDEQPRRGAFGLPATDLGTPLENEVWGKLHGISSVAGREGR